MNKQDYIFPILTAFLIFSMSIFISCASQERIEQDSEFGESEEISATESDPDLEAEAEEASEETDETVAGLEEDLTEDAEDELKSLEEEADEGMQELEDELAALNDTEGEEKKADGEGDEIPGTEGEDEELTALTEDEGSENAEEGEDAIAGLDDTEQSTDTAEVDSESDEMDEFLDEDEAEDSTAVAAADTEDIGVEEEPSSELEVTSSPAELDSPEQEISMSEPAQPRIVKSTTPMIPSEAREVGGVLLNRFYFSRVGDTSASISEKIYGTPTRAEELSSWNGGERYLSRPGNIVFYNSALSPTDTQIQSLYQERGIPADKYQVSNGDWLSLIAKQQYGDIRSWREIAALNGVNDPDAIAPGQELALYPKEIPPFENSQVAAVDNQQMAQNEIDPSVANPNQFEDAPPEQVVANNEFQQAPTEPVQQIQEPMDPPQPPPQAMEPPPVQQQQPPSPPPVMEPEPSSGMGNFDINRLFGQNAIAFGIGGLILVLLLSLLIVRRRKKQMSDDDFQDDNFAPPKAKRR